MSTFMNAVQNTPTKALTNNGGVTYESSTNKIVDLFFLIGAARNTDIRPVFDAAYGMDRERTLRTLMWVRDIRGGAGERQTFRNILNHMEIHYPEDLEMVVPWVPYFGRWDDLLVFESEKFKSLAASLIQKNLNSGNGLCAKWMPRKGKVAAELRNRLGMTPKTYRKTLVNMTDVVESKMCAGLWEDIDFEKVPSVAAARYKRAFNRHVPERFENYVEDVVSGKAEIKASAIFPHDVVKQVLDGGYRFSSNLSATERKAIVAQWDALPNFVGDSNILPMVDVSGSMGVNIGGNTSALDVAISLGMYVSEKNEGPFNGAYLTFSGEPKLEVLKGDVVTRINSLCKAEWGMNTNLERAFTEILRKAKAGKVEVEDMPEFLLVLSDMEFDSCTSRKTSFKDAKSKFKKAGYKLPTVVFWNLNGRAGNSPVTVKNENTVLVSGFSPSILKSVLSADTLTPEAIVDDTILSDRYNIFETAPAW